MNETHMRLAQQVATRYAELPMVEAVAMAGSLLSGFGSSESDIDIYVYCHTHLPGSERQRIAREQSTHAEQIDFWGPGDEWVDKLTGITVDVIYFEVGWIEEQLNRVLVRHEAWIGYTTCFWHTVKISRILFDRQGWFARMKAAAAQPYPDPLRQAIVQLNYPLLRQIIPSYATQIEHAVKRQDWVSVNHRLTALLASYFDIIFAVNRLPHPGEKRLLDFAERDCSSLPAHCREQVEYTLAAHEDVMEKLMVLLDTFDVWLKAEGVL